MIKYCGVLFLIAKLYEEIDPWLLELYNNNKESV